MKTRLHVFLPAAICLLPGAGALSPALAAASPDLAPAPRLAQAFDLGVAAYAPTAAVFRLDEVIKVSHLKSAQLAPIAEQTRGEERDAYHAADNILKQMNAANYIVQPYIAAVQTLSAPVVITDSARQHVPNDPIAQGVWSTIDEADRVAPVDNGALAAWLKISRGRNALWAYHLGSLYAVIVTPSAGPPDDDPLLDTASALANAAPSMTAQSLIDALQAVADQQQQHKLASATLKKLADSIVAVFGAGPLATSPPVLVAPAPPPAPPAAAK